MKYKRNDLNHVRGPVSLESQIVGLLKGHLKATLQCECGWTLSAMGPTEGEALESLNAAWAGHVKAMAPLKEGEEVHVSVIEVQGSGGFIAQIDSDDPRRYIPLWSCSHRHATHAEAMACGVKELERWQ
jgi:hypothetical protein